MSVTFSTETAESSQFNPAVQELPPKANVVVRLLDPSSPEAKELLRQVDPVSGEPLTRKWYRELCMSLGARKAAPSPADE